MSFPPGDSSSKSCKKILVSLITSCKEPLLLTLRALIDEEYRDTNIFQVNICVLFDDDCFIVDCGAVDFVDGTDDGDAAAVDESLMKVGMGDVEDGDVLSISVINDCTGNGDDAVLDSSLIVDMGDGDNVAVVDVCAISVGTRVIDDGVGDGISVIDVDMSVFDDDDVADVFVINEDMGEGDDVGECDKSVVVVVVAVVQASAKKNVTYKIKPAWYKPLIPPFTARQLKNKLN